MELKQTNFIFGLRAILEGIEAGKTFDKIFLKQGTTGDLASTLQKLAKERDIPVKLVPQAKLDGITRKNHQGAIGIISPVAFQNFEEIVTGVFESGRDPLILVLDEITDVRNFGAIARTALCMGVDAIVFPATNSAGITPDAVKTSSGALLTIPVCKVKSLPVALEKMKEYSLRIIGCTEKGNTLLPDATLDGPLAIVVGSEEHGLSTVVLRIADELVRIPMSGPVQSLNVSVATGMILYEARRKR